MKLASLRAGRDGKLIVVSKDGVRYRAASRVALTLQAALDNWSVASPQLTELSRQLEADPESGSVLDCQKLCAPLPRAYEWVDASAFISHVLLVRKARGSEPPATLLTCTILNGVGDFTANA